MSAIKDIMDVDLDPLESQAYRRREAAQQASSLSHPTIPQTSHSPSPSIDDESSNKGKNPLKQRKPNRVSKPAAQYSSSAQQNLARRRDSAGGETMDYPSTYQPGGSNQASMSGSPQQSPRGSEPVADLPVKYTPVTGRLSRAKKGVPVHTCDICRPVKTFTRAEHLRRHQLSHQKPAYPCTFEDCERAFHRPDLLARHLHRHETQGEKAYKAGDPRSRASSSASESRTPSLNVEPPFMGASGSGSHASPMDLSTPRTSGSDGSSMTATNYNTATGSFQPVNDFSGSAGSKRTAGEAQLPDSGNYPGSSSGEGPSVRNPRSFSTQMDSHSRFGPGQSGLDESYLEARDVHYTTVPQLPLLSIPDGSWYPDLSYSNSPWNCSSASSSTYSTSDSSRTAPQLPYTRGRSLSVATQPEWTSATTAPFWTQGIQNTSQDIRSPSGFDMMDAYDTPYSSPRISTPVSARPQLLNIPTSMEGYYNMETSVGTPTLPTYSKPLAQNFPASTPRYTSNSGLELLRGKKELVEPPQLTTFSLATPTFHPQSSFDTYLSTYWDNFHPSFPVIHQSTFDSSQNEYLTSAMAAIGTQYHDSPEARTKGAELNEYCRKGIELCPSWNLQTMQAILLNEFFTRFRGRKTTVRISREFEALYFRLLNEAELGQFTMPIQSPALATSAEALLDRFGPQPDARVLRPDDHSDWNQWLEHEARQRLLSACFMFDVHQSLYHQQSRVRGRENIMSLVCLPCPDSLWNAGTPTEEWQAQRSEYIPQPLHLLEQDLQSHAIVLADSFSQSLVTCWFAAKLPPRDNPRYPNDFVPGATYPELQHFMNMYPNSSQTLTYLALYNTPLYSLLAVSGDTWVFAQKITPPSEFEEAKYRLKTWSVSFAAAHATYHACQILSQILSQPLSISSDGHINTGHISDYWSLYVCALICWAYGHKYQNIGNPPLSRSGSDGDIGNMNVDMVSLSEETRLKALNYTSIILDRSVEDLFTNKDISNSKKGDTAGVIDAVRHRLEIESVGNKSGHLVDAVVVLGKIKRGARCKWF